MGAHIYCLAKDGGECCTIFRLFRSIFERLMQCLRSENMGGTPV
jgi:hypothetical protein